MMLPFLNKPYPYLGDMKKGIVINFFIGTFIAFFLIVFRPFGIGEWVTEHKTIKLLGFGFVSFFVPTLISFMISLIPKKITEDRWTIGKEISVIVIIICFIALGNLIYGRILHIMNIDLRSYIGALTSTCLLGVFPVTFYVINKHNRLLKINLMEANEVNRQIDIAHPLLTNQKPEDKNNTEIVLIAENEKDKIILHAAQLLYVESADNYANVVYSEMGKKKKQLIRSSLKRIESQINTPAITRCHRTYIVNLNNIKNIEGNAAGYRICFFDTEDTVPVSRNYGSVIVNKLKSIV